MKYKILALALIAFMGVQAQESTEGTQNKNKDRIVETKTRIISVMEDGEMVQKKVMVKTIKEQEIKTDSSYKGTVDAPRVFPATKVSKIIYIDNDSDPFYDKEAEVVYYEKDGMRYDFNPTTEGFKITDGESKLIGNARFSTNGKIYLLDTDDYSGIGYFKNGMFIVEYYDEQGTLIVKKFSESQL